MEILNLVLEALLGRAPEYVGLTILAGGGAVLYVMVRRMGDQQAEQSKQYEQTFARVSDRIEETAKLVSACETNHRTEFNTMMLSLQTFKTVVARETVTKDDLRTALMTEIAPIRDGMNRLTDHLLSDRRIGAGD